MKLTPDNLNQKLGKKVDISTIQELSLDSLGVIEVSSFSRLKLLEVLDLSQNRLQQIRHIKGLFDLPAIRELNLTGNPVTKSPNYRATVISSIPTLQVLDGKKITAEEREAAKQPIVKDPLSQSNEEGEDDEPVAAAKPVPKVEPVVAKPPVEQPKPVAVQQPVVAKPAEQPKPVAVANTPAAKPVEQPKPVATPAAAAAKPTQAATAQPTVEKITKQVKKNLFVDEDILFESSSKPRSIKFDEDNVDDDLFKTDDDLQKFEKKKPVAAAPAKKSSISFVEDDDDDIFGSSKKTTSNTKKSADIDDDLFGDFEEKGALKSDFDISNYISSQKDRKKGGLFD